MPAATRSDAHQPDALALVLGHAVGQACRSFSGVQPEVRCVHKLSLQSALWVNAARRQAVLHATLGTQDSLAKPPCLPHGQGPQLASSIKRSAKSTAPSPLMSSGHLSHGPQAARTARKSLKPAVPSRSRSCGPPGSVPDEASRTSRPRMPKPSHMATDSTGR